MQFPESWLREFCDPPLSTAELAHTLTMAGLEVEALDAVAPPCAGVVVGHVLTVAQHPNADRLKVCEVDVGGPQPLQIVCGAPNVRVGIKVPCALAGAELPPAEPGGAPMRIQQGVLRGVESQGMLCSARELRLSDDHGGLLILADDAEIGRDIRAQLQLDDTLFTLKLTPNLGHCLSVHGVARELSALTGAPLKAPAAPPVPPAHDRKLGVQVAAADLCGRFSGRVVQGVDARVPTPAWMVERLARCGQRSVSALVDISNYVMFELGQPSHIFDLDKIDGDLVVRWARPGEQLTLLNGSTVALDGDVGVIALAHGGDAAVESLAGIMGGDATAVGDATRNIYVEAAFWWPEAVAGRSRRFNFATDAGHRFERGVDPALTVPVLERLTGLILSICGGAPGPVDDQTLRLPTPAPVTLRVDRAARVIGMPVTDAQCEDVFRRLGVVHTAEPGRIHVTPPSWRFDLRIEEDLIEEVIRLIGYGALPDTPPHAPIEPRVRSETRRSAGALRRQVAALGYQEVISYSFVEARRELELAGNAHPIGLLNPIAAPLAVMRSSLLGSLIQVLQTNLARKAGRVRVFEIGRVFLRDADAAAGPLGVGGIRQPLRVAGLAYGPVDALQWGSAERPVDFFDAKGDVEALCGDAELRFVAADHPALHPGRSARIERDGEAIGWVGELHPRWRQAYELPQAPVLFELDADALQRRALPQARPVPKHQAAVRDLALWVPDAVPFDAVRQAIHAAPSGGVLRDATLFDVYRPKAPEGQPEPGERSMAIRLSLLDDNATLTEARIEAAVQAVVAAVSERLGARLRT